MGKIQMPTRQELFNRRRIYGPKKDPVWVYIMREMKQKAHKKPYNNKVANWLLFLKDLRYHYYSEAIRQYNRLCKEIGPTWYIEYSKAQKDILVDLRAHIHEDLLEDTPIRVKKALRDLGLTLPLPSNMLLSAMSESTEDPGLFLWSLYRKIYKVSPSKLQPKYTMNSMLLMSALVFIDLDECIERLDKLITFENEPPPPPVHKKKPAHVKSDVKKYGTYLSKIRVSLYSTHPEVLPEPKKPRPINNRIKPRTEKSYERLFNSTDFLAQREQRNQKMLLAERKCKYKFWQPPYVINKKETQNVSSLLMKKKMMKLRAKKRHLKYKPPFQHVQCVISTVTYSSSKPVYLLSTIYNLPTGYMPIHGGLVWFGNELVTIIAGMSLKPADKSVNKDCDCREKWKHTVMNYVKTSKCYCEHLYEYGFARPADVPHAKSGETFFYPPKENNPYLFDYAKIYQCDNYVEFVRTEFKTAIQSESTIIHSPSDFQVASLNKKELLKVFLADLADTPLLIPHLPQADLLNNLQEWVRKKIKGNITPEEHKKLMLISERRWLYLSHIDYRTKAKFIPFTIRELKNLNWSHRDMIQKLAVTLQREFAFRTKKDMLEHTRIFWNSMKNDVYPNKTFLETFFTYMPGRMIDTYVLNPYASVLTPKYGAKTCSLSK